ncbi:MAG: type VI secretion system baseplate subunit TssF [Wenzhouxiangella sp.]|nr:MAG: type VI secretion system baseplate subunit TssF [Wenzhouxiangella sp.]
MDPGLLKYYNTELQHLRELGGEFAKEYPKIAGRLGLEEFECADPYVERLLEGCAFLTARLQLKIDREYEKFTQHLLEVVYPHFLAPTPSMCVVQLAPDPTEGSLSEGFVIEADTALRSEIGRGEQTACEFRTRQRTTLWPLEIRQAQFLPTRGDVAALGVTVPNGTRSGLRLRFGVTAGLKVGELQLDELEFYLKGSGEVVSRLMEQLHAGCLGFQARSRHQGEFKSVRQPPENVEMPGFASDEAMLPFGYRSFQGYRLVQEYFAFPERFRFARLKGLAAAIRESEAEEFEVVIFFDRPADVLDNSIDIENFLLFCAPAINLFPRHCDRIHVSQLSTELHVIPDRTRPMDFEVHSVMEVKGFNAGVTEAREFKPFFWSHDRASDRSQTAFFTQRREPRKLSSRQNRNGPRSSYVGSELFLSIVDGLNAPFSEKIKQVAVRALCTNRDLPLHMPLSGKGDFSLLDSAPVANVRCVAGPTSPKPRFSSGDVSWRLLSHLNLNYLSLLGEQEGNGAASLREMLELYADLSDASLKRQVEGLSAIKVEPVVRRLPLGGPITAGRGLRIDLTLDETCFEGLGIFLLGRIMREFLARYASINSFTETRILSTDRGEIVRWPLTTGRRLTI